MGWLDKDNIEVLRHNFVYVAILALCGVIIVQYKDMAVIQKQLTDERAERYKETRLDMEFWRQSELQTSNLLLYRSADTAAVSRHNGQK